MFYIDSEFKCHVSNDGTMTAVEDSFFDNKCDTFIEGYRYIPDGESWTNEGGISFVGKMIAPWKDYNELNMAQRCYEYEKLAEYEKALSEIEDALEV